LLAVAAVVVAGVVATGATGVLQAGTSRGVDAIRGVPASAPTPPHHPAAKTSKTPSVSAVGPSAANPPTSHKAPEPRKTPKSRKSQQFPEATLPGHSAVSPKPADAKKVRKRIRRAHKPKHAGHSGMQVLDAATGKALYEHRAGKPMTPASTSKLLTTSAALHLLGPQHRFRTLVVAGKSSQIILVGGGDPYLASKKHKKEPHRGSLQQLAAATAKRLRSKHVTKVRLGYDTSLFSGPRWNPHWNPGYHNQVSPISALWADEGRVGASPGPREHHPAKSAARIFAHQLKKHKIKTTSIAKAHADRGRKPIASVKSLPLSTIVERLLRVSDNDAAEVVARQVAIADHEPATFTGAVSAIKHTLKKIGIWRFSAKIYDGSGLSHHDRVPPAMFAAILHRAITDQQAHWGPLLAGLPVAGKKGSLAHKYNRSHTKSARGLVHAKTGTLHGVHSLAGYVHTRDGELLIFVLMADHSKQDYTTPIWLRRISARIAACGCRR
jgi:D-alanyl-D-alanine carboxypeptidase/D-alanyl-D-alanine-endopeptidase (penicillin-binding protein 4)